MQRNGKHVGDKTTKGRTCVGLHMRGRIIYHCSHEKATINVQWVIKFEKNVNSKSVAFVYSFFFLDDLMFTVSVEKITITTLVNTKLFF